MIASASLDAVRAALATKIHEDRFIRAVLYDSSSTSIHVLRVSEMERRAEDLERAVWDWWHTSTTSGLVCSEVVDHEVTAAWEGLVLQVFESADGDEEGASQRVAKLFAQMGRSIRKKSDVIFASLGSFPLVCGKSDLALKDGHDVSQPPTASVDGFCMSQRRVFATGPGLLELGERNWVSWPVGLGYVGRVGSIGNRILISGVSDGAGATWLYDSTFSERINTGLGELRTLDVFPEIVVATCVGSLKVFDRADKLLERPIVEINLDIIPVSVTYSQEFDTICCFGYTPLSVVSWDVLAIRLSAPRSPSRKTLGIGDFRIDKFGDGVCLSRFLGSRTSLAIFRPGESDPAEFVRLKSRASLIRCIGDNVVCIAYSSDSWGKASVVEFCDRSNFQAFRRDFVKLEQVYDIAVANGLLWIGGLWDDTGRSKGHSIIGVPIE